MSILSVRLIVLASALAFGLAAAATAGVSCVGDCDGDGQVSVAELVTGVGIALGVNDRQSCPSFDVDGNGSVTVAELVQAVAAALGDCVADTPIPTATPEATLTPSSSPTMPVACGDGIAGGEEECDDGNSVSGDGCSAACELERGGDVCAGVETTEGTYLQAELIMDGLTQPVHVTAAPLDPHRLFIVEQRGQILIWRDGLLLASPFLSIRGKVFCGERSPDTPCGGGDERGLLSMAFHPNFEENGWFFVNYTNNSSDTVVARYSVSAADPDRADPDSERILFTVDQPFSNHNGGQVAFGPDGFLYVGMGDGGGRADPLEASQDDERVLGKMLRLDVDVAGAPYFRVPDSNPNPKLPGLLGLIWAKGLRNPWRFSFDRDVGDLYIADVGQNRFEEIDVQPAGSTGGENYGWDIFEASTCFEPEPLFADCPDPPTAFVHPVLEYGRTDGVSVTGGFVYRGCALPDLSGTYFYADFGSAFIRSFELVGGAALNQQDWTAELGPGSRVSIRAIASFGEDARGEIYIVDRGGEIFKIVGGAG